MYSVKWVTLCKLMASLVCILINNVISTQQSNHETSKLSTSEDTVTSNNNSSTTNIRRLMQYDDLPLGEQSEPVSFPDESSDNHSLFRPPAFQEPILEPIDPASVIGSPSSDDTRSNNSSWTGVSPSPEVHTTTTASPKNSSSISNETKQIVEQAVVAGSASTPTTNLSNNHNNNNIIKRQPLNFTASNAINKADALAGIGTSDLQHMLRYMVTQRELQRQRQHLKPSPLLPPLVKLAPRRRLPSANYAPIAPSMSSALMHGHQLVGPRQQASRPPREHSPYQQPLNSFTSKIWSLFSPQPWSWSTYETPTNEVTRFNWVYPRQVPKKRRNQQPSAPVGPLKPAGALKMLRVGQRLQPQSSLVQSASHLNSYTLDPAEDADLGGGEFIGSPEHQDPSTAFHLAQEDATNQFPVELEAPSYSSGGHILSSGGGGGEYPMTVVGDTAAEQQALLLSSLIQQQQQQLPKKRKRIVKVPLSGGVNQLAASYLELANSQDSQLGLGSSAETQASSTTKEYASNPILSTQQQAAEPDDAKQQQNGKPQQVPSQDDGSEQPLASGSSRRKPTRAQQQQAAPRQKRARHATRNQLRAHNKNLQNFYDYGPVGGGGDLQPSSTFLRWKYPQMYDDNDEEGETELNIRFFNNFSRVGPLTGLGRNVATATLIISLVLLIISNICMVGTYVVHGLSALSTFYGLPQPTTTSSSGSSSSSSSFLARPKNVTSLSYTNWDSLLPPFIRQRTTSTSTTSTTTTSTTLAPYLSSRSLLSARQHQQPSMTFDSEIKAFGDSWK